MSRLVYGSVKLWPWYPQTSCKRFKSGDREGRGKTDNVVIISVMHLNDHISLADMIIAVVADGALLLSAQLEWDQKVITQNQHSLTMSLPSLGERVKSHLIN